MTEENKLKRKWVKKASIIFFIIMLLLTFFSNTIMNYSLPEVSVKRIGEGKITTEIRGTGVVEAVSNYDVVIAQTRKVEKVLGEPGDSVNAGDVLFLLEDKESEELKNALDTLEDLNLQYQKALINQESPDYTIENRNIERTRGKLLEAQKERSDNQVEKKEVDIAETVSKHWKKRVDDLNSKISEIQEEISKYSGATDDALLSLRRSMKDKEDEVDDANSLGNKNPISLNSLELELQRLQEDYDLLLAKYPDYENLIKELAEKESNLKKAESKLSKAQKDDTNEDNLKSLKEEIESLDSEIKEIKNNLNDCSEIRELKRRIEDQKNKIDSYEPYVGESQVDEGRLKRELKRLERDYATMASDNDDYNEAVEKYDKLKDQLKTANEELQKAEERYEVLSEKYQKWEVADEEVTGHQETLEDSLFTLEETKEKDAKAASIDKLDVEKLQKDIAEQKKEVDKLRNDAVGGKVVAEKSGIIKSIEVSAGKKTSPNMALAVIESNEEGYSLSFSVTKEQSKKVSIGDSAKVSEDNDISASLRQIKNDSQNPEENKLLVFSLEGEIEQGDAFSLVVEKPSTKYEFIVPNSALHSDSDGSFVLTVQSKKTPFGSRYKTMRVGVDVLGKDDQNTAVSGALQDNDYVITTSTEVLEPEMQVQMMKN